MTVPSHQPTVWMSAGICSAAVPGAPMAPVGKMGASTLSDGMTRWDPLAPMSATRGPLARGRRRGDSDARALLAATVASDAGNGAADAVCTNGVAAG